MKARYLILSAAITLLTACSSPPDGGDAGPSDAASDAGADTARQDAGTPDGTSDASPDASEQPCEPGESVDATINGWTVTVDRGNGAWSVTPPDGDAPVLEGPSSCPDDSDKPAPVRLSSGQPAIRNQFGAFQIDIEPPEVRWARISERAPEYTRIKKDGEDGENAVELRWRGPVGDNPTEGPGGEGGMGAPLEATLRIEAETTPAGTENLRISVRSPAAARGAELNMHCGAEEAFFGLGTQVTGLNLRGRTYPLWTQEQGNGKPENGGVFPLNNIPEAAYAPMGVWHSSAGYSAIIGHDAYSELDLCERHDDRVSLRSFGEPSAYPEFVLVAGESPKERLTAITEYTGRLNPEPPAWVFGPWLDAVGGAWRIEEVVKAARDNDIPASAVWAEDWIGGENTGTGFRLSYKWAWDTDTYPMLPGRIDGLHADGFAFLAYFNPFVPETVPRWQEAVDNGYLIEDAGGDVITFKDPAFRDASLVDLSDPQAVEWLKGYQTTAARDLEIDGWMADFAEWWPLEAQPEGEATGWNYHNRYPLAWQRANRASLESVHQGDTERGANDWTFFARSGWASTNGGSAGTTPTMWGGDQDTDWDYDDGFPTIIPIGTHVGLAGVAIFGSDIAGYNSIGTPNTTKELFFRWSAAGAFHPLMRTHHGGDECENWSFDRDDESIAHFRRWASVHTLLYPYFRTLAAEAMQKGWPITRHPWLVEPEAAKLWEGEDYLWFVGDDILVAPVLEEGAGERVVELPGAGWWPLFGDTPESATDPTVSAAPTETPAFVRPGAALPLLWRPVDSFYGAEDMTPDNQSTSDLSDVAGKVRLALYPDTGDSGNVSGSAKFEGSSISVDGTGWKDAGSLDWSAVSLDGNDLPSCEVAADGASCTDATGRSVRLFGLQTGTLTVDGAELTLQADADTDWRIAVAADAWGEFAEPTTLENLKGSGVPSQCADAPENTE